MELPVGDIFDAENETVPENQKAEENRRSYATKSCEIQTRAEKLLSEEDNYSFKLAGDLAYLNKDYSSAIDFYNKYLENTKSEGGGTVRDVLESVTRSYICLRDFKNAQIYCDKLLKVGHLVNVLQLRIELARSQDDWSQQTGSLICQLLDIHPWLDRLWLLLGEWYRVNNDHNKEYWCLEKASQTEESVNIADINCLKAENKLNSDLKTQIAEKVLKNISVPRQARSNQNAEFVDLGSSVKLKEQEDKLNNMTSISEEDCDKIIEIFEHKWFS